MVTLHEHFLSIAGIEIKDIEHMKHILYSFDTKNYY